MLCINLGGEGEVPGVLNQQPPGALGPNWFTTTLSNPGKTIADLTAAGVPVLLCPNDRLPFPDGVFDTVYTNSVPLDMPGVLGPGVQWTEIQRILKSGGVWVRNGLPHYWKP